MRRRAFITLLGGAAVAWPIAALAQQAAKPTIGFLRAGKPPKTWLEAFQQGLRELGYVDGQNVIVEVRFTDGSVGQLPQLVDELVRLKANVIVASGSSAAAAAKKATSSVPIVFASVSNPVETGLVASLARPGGNITGMAFNSADLAGKRLELLRELIPGLRQVAILSHPGHPTDQVQLEGTEVAARTLGMTTKPLSVLSPSDFDSAFKVARDTDAVLYLDGPFFTTHRAQLTGLTTASRLPAVYGYREMVEAGGLMSYGPQIADFHKRAATHVDKILKGAKPADLPVEQPTKFELVINLKTAKALGLTIPPSLLARADEVIE